MRDEIRETMPEPQMEMEMNELKEYRPSNNEMLRNYEINIRFLNRGCIVRVGCKEIAFEDHTSAMVAVNAYVANPYNEERKWRKILD